MDGVGVPRRARPLRVGDPQWVGAYEIVGFLGEGGMGAVFLGRSRDGSLVAIKVIKEELARHPEFRARFRREAQSALRVPRFCTAEVVAADPDAPAPYLVTEYIDGPTLEEVVKAEGPLRGAELDQLGVSMAAALTGIHGTGVIHRDLKPANVLLSRFGPRVIDFGIASAVDAIRLTVEGQALGTPSYMAPEQLQGNPVQASDVFCWGGVMAFAATGRRPFGTGPLPEVAARIVYSPPDLEGMHGPLREVVLAAMNKEPAARPTPSQLLRMLGVSGDDPAQAVRTRLEGMGPDESPLRTRNDIPSTLAMPPDVQQPNQDVSYRFGPGLGESGSGSRANPPLAPAVAETWRTGKPPKPPRRRRPGRIRNLLSSLASLAVIIGVLVWLLHPKSSPPAFAVTGLTVGVEKPKYTCDANAQITGTVTTNGSAGDLSFQWKRSDRSQPEDQQVRSVPSGQKTVALQFLWQISGASASRTFTATLTILNAPTINKSASFVYSCKHA